MNGVVLSIWTSLRPLWNSVSQGWTHALTLWPNPSGWIWGLNLMPKQVGKELIYYPVAVLEKSVSCYKYWALWAPLFVTEYNWLRVVSGEPWHCGPSLQHGYPTIVTTAGCPPEKDGISSLTVNLIFAILGCGSKSVLSFLPLHL